MVALPVTLPEGGEIKILVRQAGVDTERPAGIVIADHPAITWIFEGIAARTDHTITVQIGVLDIARSPVVPDPGLIRGIIHLFLGLENAYGFITPNFTQLLTNIIFRQRSGWIIIFGNLGRPVGQGQGEIILPVLVDLIPPGSGQFPTRGAKISCIGTWCTSSQQTRIVYSHQHIFSVAGIDVERSFQFGVKHGEIQTDVT